MLSELQLDAILEVFQRRMQEVSEMYLKRMGEHLKEIGTLTASDINRVVEMKRVGYNVEQMKREIAKAADASIKDIDKVFEAVAESDARFAADVFAADHTPTIKNNPALERILKAQAKITKQALANLSQTTITAEAYKNAVDVAIQAVQSGITDYQTAIRKAMKDAAVDNLRVTYPSGYTRRLDSAMRMNILDGIRAVNQDVSYQLGKEFGADGVEISAHAMCAEEHLPYQGKQMSIKEFEHLQNVVLDRPLGMWNCRHTWHYIILGVSVPQYSQQELRDYRRNSSERITIEGETKSRYEWTQEQRRIETAIRQQKDIAVAAKASGDMTARRECQYIIGELEKRYANVSKAADLIAKRERMTVSGFKAVKPMKPQ
jgi:phage-related protein